MKARDKARLSLMTATVAAPPAKRPQRPGVPRDPMTMLQQSNMRIEQRLVQQNQLLMQILERLPPLDDVTDEDMASDEPEGSSDEATVTDTDDEGPARAG